MNGFGDGCCFSWSLILIGCSKVIICRRLEGERLAFSTRNLDFFFVHQLIINVSNPVSIQQKTSVRKKDNRQNKIEIPTNERIYQEHLRIGHFLEKFCFLLFLQPILRMIQELLIRFLF